MRFEYGNCELSCNKFELKSSAAGAAGVAGATGATGAAGAAGVAGAAVELRRLVFWVQRRRTRM